MSKINTSAEAITAIMKGVIKRPPHAISAPAGYISKSSRLIPALAAERDALRVRAEQAERRETAMKSANEEARHFLRERDALRAEVERLRATPPEVTALVEALRRIAAPGYGLQGLMEDGASGAEIASYWAEKARRYKAVARAALTEWEASQK